MAELHTGNCRVILPKLKASSFDAIVTDPPYEYNFMWKKWDRTGVAFKFGTWADVFRVAKPGAHLLAFGGPRTYHRLVCAIEDGGWEIRDCLMWIYGTGFPKSLDVSKAIDKEAGADREVVGKGRRSQNRSEGWDRPWMRDQMTELGGGGMAEFAVTAPATEAARRWAGFGTALKPSVEPIVLARKPLNGTVAGNVLKHGTGVLNIDACRTEGVVPQVTQGVTRCAADGQAIYGAGRELRRVPQESNPHPSGRWPANLIFTHHQDCTDKCVDGCPVRALDDQAGERKPGRFSNSTRRGLGYMGAKSEAKGFGTTPIGDSGGASRYYATFSWEADDFIPFLYCPKASKRDRGAGNTHATVKPNQLMRWLCRLITPPGGLILDPFMGSGSTGKAAVQEGFRFVGIDADPDNIPIAEGRIAAAVPGHERV